MKDITKEDFAIGTICLDIIDAMLTNYDFNHEFKRRFSIASKNANWIFDRAYKGEPMEEFEEYRNKVYLYMQQVVEGNFELKDKK